MSTQTITKQTMSHKKSTKRTEVYERTDENDPVSTIYIDKGAMPDGKPPQWIELNVTYNQQD